MQITARIATPEDDVTVLWPDTSGMTLNLEQVVVAVDEAGVLLAGALMFHGGHSLAYVGSIVFVSKAHQARIVHALLAFVVEWCRERGVTQLGHGAGTMTCCQTFLRLGARVRAYQTLMELSMSETQGAV